MKLLPTPRLRRTSRRKWVILWAMAALLILDSCTTQPESPVLQIVQVIDPKVYEEIVAEVSKGGWEIKRSLPELKYARHRRFLGRTVDAIELRSSEGGRFQVLVLNCRDMAFPGEDFKLAYLKNPKGHIVDWKSRWFYNRRGRLETRLLDVNDDGVRELCFVCSPVLEGPEQLLSAFGVRNGKFHAFIAEDTSAFSVKFRDTVLRGNIVIEPQLKGSYIWDSDKLYEIPVRVINRGTKPATLGSVYVALSGGDRSPTFTLSRGLEKEELAPGESVETVVTMRFSPGTGDQTLSFELEKPEKFGD